MGTSRLDCLCIPALTNTSPQCDEQKPQCGNCVKHNVRCAFIATSGSPAPIPRPDELNMADLELLHNYSTTTYATLTTWVTIREFYRTTIVQLDFQHDYIMRTVLAISALHIAHYRPSMRDHYLSLAATHHQIASRTVMGLMVEPLTPVKAELLFIFSTLTTYFGET